ncbi:MAG: hypothetical protein P4L50_29090 [Anaerolineaceae bacterium]|nr:hypothetical protein [Anaerolineaceae bacterium]
MMQIPAQVGAVGHEPTKRKSQFLPSTCNANPLGARPAWEDKENCANMPRYKEATDKYFLGVYFLGGDNADLEKLNYTEKNSLTAEIFTFPYDAPPNLFRYQIASQREAANSPSIIPHPLQYQSGTEF